MMQRMWQRVRQRPIDSNPGVRSHAGEFPPRGAGFARARVPRRGWVFIDTVVGLGILALVGAVLTATLVRVGRGRDRLEEFRSATRLLESAGAEIGAGRATPAGVHAEELTGPDGARWLRLSIKRPPEPAGARRASDVSLVVPDSRVVPDARPAPTHGGGTR